MKLSDRSWLHGIFAALLMLCVKVLFAAGARAERMPLFDNLGQHHYPVSTPVAEAQRYFNQGIILSFGFNHAEAARSFQQARRLDANCAMCYWGEALVLGPNINAPMDPAAAPRAYEVAHKALELAGVTPEKEKALIEALSKRYAKTAPSDRSSLDEAYAAAMRDVAKRFPEDAVIASLLAEALMDQHPWDFWTIQGEARPWTAEIVATLERALQLDDNNPLANHLYIHAMEASPFAEKAIASAQRLPSLVPGSGHLVHMPAHIYIRVGRYRDAALANQAAVKIDQGYLAHSHVESIYTLAYVPHNHHFLWAAAIKTGQKQLASKAAADTAAHVDPEMMREPGFKGTLQHFYTIPLYTKALFGEWDAVLNEPAPAADLLYVRGVWHYARGLALLRKGDTGKASEELSMLEAIAADPDVAQLTILELNSVLRILQIAAAILEGELAAQKGDFDAAITKLRRAVAIEDGLNYTEPKDWYLPPRQVLGAVLLAAGRLAEAQKVYRKDLVYHLHNGWSLFGLMQSLNAQHKMKEADAVRQQFEEEWADADVTITSSRY